MPENTKRRLTMAVAVIVIIGSLVWMYLTLRRPAPRVNKAPLTALGQVVAEEAARMTGGSGSIVIVVYDGGDNVPSEALQAALGQQAGLQVAAVERIRSETATVPSPQIGPPAGRFLEILQQHADASLVVSFVGVPLLSDGELAQLPARRPQVLVFADGPSQLRLLFARGLIQAAIVPQFRPPDLAALKSPAQTPREWFDRYYLLVTPDNLGDTPF